MQLPIDDKHSYNKDYLLAQLAILMAGRIAEEKYMHHMTTGAGNDIERATELARSMVTEWGMSDEFGPLNFSGGKHEVFLGRDFSSNNNLSEDTAKRIDAEIRRIVTDQYDRAKQILTDHRKELEAMGEALLEYETLDGDDIDTLLRGGKITRALPTTVKKAKEAAAADGEPEKKRPTAILPPISKPEPA
jgi:cell division protease FtsH